MESLLFYILAGILLGASLLVITSSNPIHSVLYLVVAFFAIAGHFLLLNAQFLAAVHIIVYAGAIMVLFLFVIMLLNLNKETEPQHSNWVKLLGVMASGLLFLVIIAGVKSSLTHDTSSLVEVNHNSVGLVKNLGVVLYRDYLIPFEVSSILFLAAIVGAIVLGKKNADGENS
jgi:NADH-quinone oxidoreductase subunit J